MPGRDLREDPERLEADDRRFGVEHLERLGGEPTRCNRVRLVLEHRLGQSTERAPADNGLTTRLRRFGDLGHLDDDGREVGEPPRCASGEIAPLERRRELDRPQQQLARAAERLARERATAGIRQRLRRFLAQLCRSGAVELCEQAGSLVEMERADLEQLVAGALAEPLGERVV